MNKRNMTMGMAVGFSVFVAGCAGTPPQNDKVSEARAAYEQIENDPEVARSGDQHLRSARNELSRAESLLEDEAKTVEIEHAAYLAHRHAQIASQQARRAELQKEVDSAESRRREMKLQISSGEAEQARREAEQLRQQMEEMKEMEAQRTDRGMVLTLGDVLFDLNQAELKSSGAQTIDRLAEFMQEYEDRRVRIEGYTDGTGDASYNQELSRKRAEAVRNALINQGIRPERIETKGYGEQYPVATNDTAAGRQQNRRVEIVISDENGNLKSREG